MLRNFSLTFWGGIFLGKSCPGRIYVNPETGVLCSCSLYKSLQPNGLASSPCCGAISTILMELLCFQVAMHVCLNMCLAYSPNRFMCRGSAGLGKYGLELSPDPFVKTADNFCAQARYLVHVAFASLRRKYLVAALL